MERVKLSWKGRNKLRREVLTVSEVAKTLGIGRNSAYELIRQHKLPALRLGRRIVIPRVALQRFLDQAGQLATESETQGPPT